MFMSPSRKRLPALCAKAVIATSFALLHAQSATSASTGHAGGAAHRIEGSYKVVLTLPKAKPTAILTFCSSDEPFTGAWVENDGRKVMGQMYNQKIDGDRYLFTVRVGPGVWDFVVSFDGKNLKGTVTGDGATSAFEGPRTKLAKEYCE